MAWATVKGSLTMDSPPVELLWRDGDVTSDSRAALDYLAMLVGQDMPVAMTPTGPFSSTGKINEDMWAFIATARAALLNSTYNFGDVPPPERPVPPDAVS